MIAAERSDWNVLLDNRRFTVQEPEPLNMTDTEMIDFIADECYGVEYTGAGFWRFAFDGSARSFRGPLRDAISEAAAYHKEANE